MTPTVLALYNPLAPTKVCADASSYGFGAMLMQLSEATWRPVAYASRSMNGTEKRYAQIEKEALAVTWACEMFATYILGMKFLIETDHKPPPRENTVYHSNPSFSLTLSKIFILHHARSREATLHVSRAHSASEVNDSRLEEEAEAVMELSVNKCTCQC